MKKFLVMLMAAMIAMASVAAFIPSYAETELLNWEPDASCLAGDVWDVYDGQFCAPLQCPDKGQYPDEAKDENDERAYPTKEIISAQSDNGEFIPVARFALDAVSGYVNFGNCYGIMEKVQPNTTYTAKATVMFNSGNGNRGEIILGYYNLTDWGKTSDKTVIEPSNFYQTVELVFTTGDDVSKACLMLGPNGFLGEVEAGYELLVSDFELYEGDVTAPDTGDAGIAAVIVLAVALLATVVFTKKKVFGN